MLLPFPSLIEARLLRRYKRFLADVRLPDGSEVTAHCPNPGRMTSCMPDEGRVLLSDQSHNRKRKLRYTWELAECDGTWVVVNTAQANRVARAALSLGLIPELAESRRVSSEARVGNSRLDFRLEGDPPTYVEVKQVTLRMDDCAAFPDAVTQRGRRHLNELRRLAEQGYRAVSLYLVGRADVSSFRPAHEVDPDYAEAWWKTRQAGVTMLAYRLQVSPEGLDLGPSLPLETGVLACQRSP